MKFITDTEIRALDITPLQCIGWVRDAFLLKHRCQLPPKISVHPQGYDFINTMPCLLPEEYHRFGCKIISRIEGSHPALKSEIIVIDSGTGKTLAILNGDWITAMRTGSVAALAVNTFCRKATKIYSIVGLGVTGRATLLCLLDLRRERGMIIRLKRYKDHAEKIIDEFAPRYPEVVFEIADTMEELVVNADVIISCITSADGLLVEDTSLFKPGVLIVPVHTRGFQNCDTIFDKVFADDEGHVRGFKYFNEFREFGEIGDVLSEKITGRTNDDERILSYNIGLGLHDIFFATKIIDLFP